MVSDNSQGLTANVTKRKLSAGKVTVGTWIQMVRTPSIARMIAAAGMDFVFIDMNDNTLLAIQIESPEAIERIDEILGGTGVDLVEIGRGDLSTNLGVPLETRHSNVLRAVDEIIGGCQRNGITAGMLCASVEEAPDMLSRGIRSICYGSDRSILMRAYADAVAGVAAWR